jgi:hypothetical protein
VTIHVCGSDGQMIGEFEEQPFLDALLSGQFPPDSYYWHVGMPDWKPITDYRAMAKTQRISFAPPKPATVRIAMDSSAQSSETKPQSAFGRLWQRLTGRR